MREKKFIIVEMLNGERQFRAGYVFYHSDLLNKNESDKQVVGGGMFMFDHIDKTIIFFGKSHDFGIVDPDEMNEIIKQQEEDIKLNLSFVSESLDGVDDLSEYEIKNRISYYC